MNDRCTCVHLEVDHVNGEHCAAIAHFFNNATQRVEAAPCGCPVFSPVAVVIAQQLATLTAAVCRLVVPAEEDRAGIVTPFGKPH